MSDTPAPIDQNPHSFIQLPVPESPIRLDTFPVEEPVRHTINKIRLFREMPSRSAGSSSNDEATPLTINSEFDLRYDRLGDEFDTAPQTGTCDRYFTQRIFDQCLSKICRRCPDLKKIIKEDSATMHKQMLAWVARCGLTGALWTLGYALGASVDKATPSGAGTSRLAWIGAGLGQALAEALCVTFIGYYLSSSDEVIQSNSNEAGIKQNLKEGAFWGMSCVVSGTLWQPVVNRFCSSEDLSQFAPVCMVKVGATTGATFGTTLACIKMLNALAEQCSGTERRHFRGFNLENTISDSVLFGLLVCGAADAFFVLTSSNSPFNYRTYSGADQFEPLPVLAQMGYSALSTMLGGLAAYALRGGLSAGCHLYDNWGDISRALKQYRRDISLNSQCIIL